MRYFMILLVLLAGCAPNLTTGFKTLSASQLAAEVLASAAGATIESVGLRCAQQHTTKAGFRKCVAPVRSLGHKWVKYIKPGINTTFKLVHGGLVTADRVKGKYDWRTALKPAVCAMALAAEEWMPLLGEHAATVRVAVAFASTWGCEVTK